MSSIAKIKVGGKQYNMPQASAMEQRKLMTVIGSKIAYLSQGTKSDAGLKLIKGTILAQDENTIIQVSDIVLDKCVINGGEAPVDINDFQGAMNSYFDLLAEGVKLNLADFFTWLDSENQKEKPTVNPVSQ